MEKIHPTKLLPPAYIFSQSLTPQWAGKKLKITISDLVGFLKIMRRAKNEGGLVSDKPPFVNGWPKDLDQTWVDMVQGQDCAKAEFCSFNTQANAKGTVLFMSLLFFLSRFLVLLLLAVRRSRRTTKSDLKCPE